MSEPSHAVVREHLIDTAKAAPLAGYVAGWFWGVNWGAVASFMAALYTMVLILDKFGLLAPIKGFGARIWHKVNPPKPLPVRTAGDE
jgi:hypothetical protein